MPGRSLARWHFLLSFLLGAGLFGCGQAGLPSVPTRVVPEVTLRMVSSEELQAAIGEQKGKIVVVDFWATWCAPCKKEFPHLVELQQKFGSKGIACMSVSVDEDTDSAAALAFLRDQNAAFPNFLLNEDAPVWQEKWSIKGVPVVLVFDRDGKRIRKFDKDDPDNQFSYADVNQFVEQLLAWER
jgi:thiol-disulfide isomerase/thioredoxin